MPDTARGLRHVEHVMGTVFSFDIRDEPTPAIRLALTEAVRQLHEVDAVFSTYRSDSHISRLDRGEIHLDDCPPEVHEVLSLCAQAAHVTDGWFSVIPAGALDPSGLVKGWATEAASRLLHEAGAHHTCVNGGGDLQIRGRASPGTPGASASPTRCTPAGWPPSSRPTATWPSPPPAPPNAVPTSSTRTPAPRSPRSPPSP